LEKNEKNDYPVENKNPKKLSLSKSSNITSNSEIATNKLNNSASTKVNILNFIY
jgi:hypothetical protein